MMTAIEPNVAATGKYNVTQTSKALGIHRNSLLKYTKEGLIKCGFGRSNGRRFFLGNEILRFWRTH